MARWRNDPRGGTDPLYDETAAETDPPCDATAAEVETNAPCSITRRELACVSGAVVWLAVLLVVLATGVRIVNRTFDNWMNGYGFTPITHVQPIAPASFTPASVTWTLPGEVAQP